MNEFFPYPEPSQFYIKTPFVSLLTLSFKNNEQSHVTNLAHLSELASVSNFQKTSFDGTPKCPGKVCLKFPSQFRQASFPNSAVCIDSLLALDGKLQIYLSRAFWGTIKKCFLEVAHNG